MLVTVFEDTWFPLALSALLVRRSGAFRALSPTCGFLVPPCFQWECRDAEARWSLGGALLHPCKEGRMSG